ncbi:hypothetical protein, partial [Vallitalea sediminicola]
KKRKYQIQDKLTAELQAQIDSEIATLNQEYAELEKELMGYREKISRDHIVMRAMDGQLVTINFEYILKVTFNNQLSLVDKTQLFFSQIGSFLI